MTPVHYIKGFDDGGQPLCGANPDNPEVWGGRTDLIAAVTCPACLDLLPNQGQQVPERWAAALDYLVTWNVPPHLGLCVLAAFADADDAWAHAQGLQAKLTSRGDRTPIDVWQMNLATMRWEVMPFLGNPDSVVQR